MIGGYLGRDDLGVNLASLGLHDLFEGSEHTSSQAKSAVLGKNRKKVYHRLGILFFRQ